MRLISFLLSTLVLVLGLQGQKKSSYLLVLGSIQDAGIPHINCEKQCCEAPPKASVVSLALVDSLKQKKYLFEASPDINQQLRYLKAVSGSASQLPDAIFITHAHIGHYTGLMYFGKEAMDAKGLKVYAMPRLKEFLETNGPWSQLVNRNNIELQPLEASVKQKLSDGIEIMPILVPHRDEYSETVGYKIYGPNKTALFIPDIDKWEKWKLDIFEEVKSVDYALIDATFYSADELGGRDMSQIPHPLVVESMSLFEDLDQEDKKKIHFIHFNHTNPLIDPESEASRTLKVAGYKIARQGMRLDL